MGAEEVRVFEVGVGQVCVFEVGAESTTIGAEAPNLQEWIDRGH